MSDALPLPPHPDVAQYERIALELQSACDAGTVGEWASRYVEQVAQTQSLQVDGDSGGQLDRAARRLEQRWQQRETKTPHGGCNLAEAHLFVAREHGFAAWSTFCHHVETLTIADSPVFNFETAADAVIAGDIASLQTLLGDHPELIEQRSTREHRSTLLHYVSGNGIEDFRQKTPPNIVAITRLLLDAGADANAESDAYGGGSTTLGLVATSMHPAEAGVQIALLETLLERGARLEQPSAGGNAQSVVHSAIANGQPDAATFLVGRGAPLDLESAAAIGRLDVVANAFDEGGVLRPSISTEQIASAFTYACGYGRKDVVDFLLERGVRPESHSVQSGLHWAAGAAAVAIVARLLQHGWPANVKHQRMNATPLELALNACARSSDPEIRQRSYEVIALLVRAGAALEPHWMEKHDDRMGAFAELLASDPRMQSALRGDVRDEQR